jgi:mannan endo-1,4-beta-mannosidase
MRPPRYAYEQPSQTRALRTRIPTVLFLHASLARQAARFDHPHYRGLVLLVTLLCACSDAGGEVDPATPDAHVESDSNADPAPDDDAGCAPIPALGTDVVRVNEMRQFEVEGQVFVPRGVNSYPLLQHVGNAQLDAVDDILTQAVSLGRPLLRTPAFLDSGNNPARIRGDDGSLREAGLVALDQVLASAAQHGVRLILILTNNWTNFGGAPAILKLVAPAEDLPKNAFWSDPRAIDNQLAYQTALATRINSVNRVPYAEDPAIFAWELANEARCERAVTPELCDDTTLARWAKRMSDGLHEAGVQQLIAWGGGAASDDYGEDLSTIAEHGGVDILTLHLYASTVSATADQTRSEAAIGWGEALLRRRAREARNAGLPLLLEEVNWKPDPTSDRDAERATVLGFWLEQADSLGIGTLPWMIGERDRTDYDGYLIRPEDSATLAVLTCE